MENNENMIEFISGTRSATLTFTNQKHINRIKKLYKERGDEFKYFKENRDGSICAKVPQKWIKINPGTLPGTGKKRELTEEQKQALRERLATGRKKAAKKN